PHQQRRIQRPVPNRPNRPPRRRRIPPPVAPPRTQSPPTSRRRPASTPEGFPDSCHVESSAGTREGFPDSCHVEDLALSNTAHTGRVSGFHRRFHSSTAGFHGREGFPDLCRVKELVLSKAREILDSWITNPELDSKHGAAGGPWSQESEC